VQLEANRLSKEGKWMEMSDLVTDEMLETFAVVGTPEQVAEQIATRFNGKVDRISPVVYQPDMALMAKLKQEIAARCS
jgi:alkanesulfonate monooxygenase SsuD/methylene tetrahydromethanopterin reductase-like flavin-dependent oxidoreductase (luciferase family)